MNFQKLSSTPARNPGVLATGTWDRVAAWRAVRRAGEQWATRVPGAGSVVRRGSAVFDLACLPDGQQVFVELGRGGRREALRARPGVSSLQLRFRGTAPSGRAFPAPRPLLQPSGYVPAGL